MNGGLVRLREGFDSLSPAERKVAAFILENPKGFLELSVAELAERSGASQAAIVRMCKSIGLKGYPELKLRVSADLQEAGSARVEYSDIQPMDSLETIIRKVSMTNIQSIKDTMKILDVDEVEAAVQLLDKAARIFFFGVGASNLIAMDAQQKLLRINKVCFAFADPHVQLAASSMVTPQDVVVCISYSGETYEMIRAAELAKSNGCKTISITKYGENTLSRTADIALHTASTETEIRSGAMSSRISQLNVIDILYLGVASRNYEQSVVNLERSRQAVKTRNK